jgi:hypothetical protein
VAGPAHSGGVGRGGHRSRRCGRRIERRPGLVLGVHWAPRRPRPSVEAAVDGEKGGVAGGSEGR